MVKYLLMELEYVKKTYEEIANRFSATRSGYYWTEISNFLKLLPKHSIVLDAGCGNGRYIDFSAKAKLNLEILGFDFCEASGKICSERGFDIQIANTKKIPYRNNCCDASISVAVIHHLESIESRLGACMELKRVTKPNGLIFIQVWAADVPKNKKFIKINDNNDYYVTWYINKTKKVKRYYHLFEMNECKELVEQSGIIVKDILYDHDNWVIIGYA